jgi:hypothetical protein
VSIDIERFDLVLGVSTRAVERAVTRILERDGWGPAERSVEGGREVRIAKIGRWVFIDEILGRVPHPWARKLSVELGALAIGGSSEEVSFGIACWEAGKEKGHVGHSGGRRTPVRARFLSAHAADARSRARLAAGIRVDDPAGALREIARLARLPPPLFDGERLQGGRALYFRRVPKIVGGREVNVRFETCFHVRGAHVDVIRAMLAEKKLPTDRAPRFFLRRDGDWLSFGEVTSPEEKERRWGAIASKRLRLPVLEVWAPSELKQVGFAVYVAGRQTGKLSLPKDIAKNGSVPLAWLAPFHPKRKRLPFDGAVEQAAVWLGRVGAVGTKIGHEIGLPVFTLAGRVEGLPI